MSASANSGRCSLNNPSAGMGKRGVQMNTKRGKYRTASIDTKRHIVTAAENAEDWRTVARVNECNENTARRWVVEGLDSLKAKARGGVRPSVQKFQPCHREFLISILEENCQATLKYLSDRLRQHPDSNIAINISTSTIKRHLDGACFTMKKVIGIPVSANTPTNKRKRKEFLEDLLRLTSLHKNIYYEDESNLNLFNRRLEERSLCGTRCRTTLPNSKGPNVHCVALYGIQGVAYYEIHEEGSMKKEGFLEWLIRGLEHLSQTVNLSEAVVVIDNEPEYSNVEQCLPQHLREVTILRMAPYSTPLSPIELYWSSVKSKTKELMAERLSLVLAEPPAGISKTCYRLNHVKEVFELAIHYADGPVNAMHFFQQVQRHYAAVLEEEDIIYGE